MLATRLLATLTSLVVSSAALAEVRVTEPWARATVAGQKVGGVYMKLVSDDDARLVGVASPAARVTEVHEMSMVDNVMKMRAIRELPLPRGKTVELKPGGYHVMLIDLAKPLAVGDRIPLTLEIAGKDGKSAKVSVTAEVRSGMPAAHDVGPHKH